MIKKSVKTIGIIAIIGIMLVCAYLLGTIQVKTETEVKEVVPDSYIPLNECIPLSDISYYFIDGYDYPCFELKDIRNQLDNDNNSSYADIMEGLADVTEDFRNNFVDMRKVVDFNISEHGLQLYLEDGTGYFIER